MAAKWYLEFHYRGRCWRVPAFRDREPTEELGRRLERIQELREVGRPLSSELERWVEGLPPRIQERLATIGLLDGRSLAVSRPLSELVTRFRKSMLAGGVTEKYADRTTAMVHRVFDGCGFQTWSDVTPLGVEGFLQDLRTASGGIGATTSNHVLASVKQFCRWMVSAGLATESPIRGLKPLNPRVDRRYRRRALTSEELRALVHTTATCPARFGMSGGERALLYRLAAETGLRVRELASLRVESFDLLASTPTVKLEAACSKHRREDVLPLRQDLARELERFLADRPPGMSVFHLSPATRTARMLRADLADAGIQIEDGNGLVDFHALRHTFITNLARANVHPKVAQTLARHSTIALTLDRYTHLHSEDQLQALEALPDLSASVERPDTEQPPSRSDTLTKIANLWPVLTSDTQAAILVIAESCATARTGPQFGANSLPRAVSTRARVSSSSNQT